MSEGPAEYTTPQPTLADIVARLDRLESDLGSIQPTVDEIAGKVGYLHTDDVLAALGNLHELVARAIEGGRAEKAGTRG